MIVCVTGMGLKDNEELELVYICTICHAFAT